MSKNQSAKIALVLDGDQRSALAVTRSLGRHGIEVVAADTATSFLAGHSRHCMASATYPDPLLDADAASSAIEEIAKKFGATTIIPMTDLSVSLVLGDPERFERFRVPSPDLNAYSAASDKSGILSIAEDLGIACPQGVYLESAETITATHYGGVYPKVLKPRMSIVRSGRGFLRTGVRIVRDEVELRKVLQSHSHEYRHGLLVQHFIPGHGAGLFAIYNSGVAIACFAHRRVREKPPGGGISVVSESVAPDPGLLDATTKLLDRLKWHGPAMVEFRVSESGVPCLMEINGRFWGSLQLAIHAGIDFPFLAWQIAQGLNPDPIEDFRIGVRNRWLLGDLDNLYLSWRSGDASIRNKLAATFRFLNFFDSQTHFEILQKDDAAPFWFELRRYFGF